MSLWPRKSPLDSVLVRRCVAGVFLAAGLLAVAVAGAEVVPEPERNERPPAWLTARDRPDDNGGAIVLDWTWDERYDIGPLIDAHFSVERSATAQGPFEVLAGVPADGNSYVDLLAESGRPFYYRVVLITATGRTPSDIIGPIHSSYQWFNRRALGLFLALCLFLACLHFCLALAKRSRSPAMRTLPGVTGIQKAVQLAATSGRPLLYTTGTQDLNEVQTIASLSLLGEVTQLVSQGRADILVPHNSGLNMAVAADVMQDAFARSGRPEAWRPDDNFYVCGEQFGYAMGVTGMIGHEPPAACVHVGSFYAEALTIAETGRTYGVYQVGGTAEIHAIPFFIMTCDEVFIGEEMFAAAAQLSGDPVQLGCVWAQDVARIAVGGVLVVGVTIAAAATLWRWPAAIALRDVILRFLGAE